MALWRQLVRGVRALTRRSAADRDADDEVQHYLDQATAAHIARGLSTQDAERAARIEIGGVANVIEQVRGYGWERVIDNLLADLRFAARRLRTEMGFTTIVVLTLALGIGASTAIFSAVNPILFQSLPYPHAERVMVIWDVGADATRLEMTFNSYRELRERARSFSAMAVLRPWQPTLTGRAEPERLAGQRVSWEYFRVLGVAPALGQDFQPSDDRAGGPAAVILSDALWRRRFGGDPAIVGRSITLGDDSHVVAGVMPKGFENAPAPAAELWTALQYEASQPRAWGHHLRMVGRLGEGVTADDAGRELNAIARAPVPEFPRMVWASLDDGVTMNTLHDDVIRGVRPALLAILGAVVLVLVIACVNVTNLLIARGVQRRAEFALRVALGAGRGRLMQQLLTESLLLAAMGGVAGMVLTMIGVRALVALSPPGLPRAGAIGVDGAVFVFGLVITTVVGFAFGLIPATQAARGGPRASSRHTTGGYRGTRSALVVTQVSLALVLLVSSGLLLRSMKRLFEVDAGFDASRLLTMQVQTSGRRFDDDSSTYRFFAEALEAVRRVPGVAAAALTSQLPLSGDLNAYGAHFFPRPVGDLGEGTGTFRYAVSPGYFETMRIPLRRGRLLNEHDVAGSAPVAVISESMARRRLPRGDPIGQRVRIGEGWEFTVVGVVGDVRQVSLAMHDADAVYTTATQWRFADIVMSLVVRARGDAVALAPAVRRAVWTADKDQPIVRVATMEELLAISAAERRFALIVFQVFAFAALVLAAAGIYGVLSGSVTERTREIGVRSALGATRRDIIALVVRQGMTLTGIGVAAGVIGAIAATRAIASMLFGVSRLDPVTYVGVVALLAGVAAMACVAPAWRAARVDPANAFRSE